MKNIKSEKGAITILVLVSVLFMLSFLISSYVIIANKVQTQKEIIAQTRSIYENYNLEDIYNSYFGKNIIPITNKEQLLAIGTGTNKIINGSYYNFSNNKETIYLLMNDIEFTAYEEETLKDENGNYYWTPIGERTDLLAGFEGNNNKIRVKYIDDENEEYTVEYSNKENYSEPEYNVKVIPKAMSEEGEVLSSAKILSAIKEEEFKEVGTGEMEVSIKRLEITKIKATSEIYKDSGIETIYIKNPNKIEEYNLVLGKYTFTIMPTPSDATVTINGENRTTISVNKGEEVSWKVEGTNYISQEGNQIINDDISLDIILSKIEYTLTIQPTPSDATVTITSNGKTLKSGTGTQSVLIDNGTQITYAVNKIYYVAKSGDITMNSDKTIPVSLTEKNEQTVVLKPVSVSGSYTHLDYAKNTESNEDSFAYTTGKKELIWTFDASSINANAKITSMTARYRLGTTVADTTATIILKANGTQYFTTNTPGLNLLLTGKQYENKLTTLPSAANIRASLTLSAKKNESGIQYLRCYGASIEIKYIDP